jgi:hypothetical protein
MFRSLILILAAVAANVSSCCREAPAQISIRESKQAYWSFPNAEVSGGFVVAPIDARPKLDRVEVTIRVETVVDYKFGQLKARRLPSYERVALDEVSKGVYKFKSSAPEGQYLLEYNAFDPDKGIASDEATVTLERAGPPVDPDPLPEPIDLPVLTREARRAMQGLTSGMAADMDSAADAVDQGRVKTVLDLASFTVPLDVNTRNVFKKAMAIPLEASLGRDALPAGSSKALREVAAGFRSVK